MVNAFIAILLVRVIFQKIGSYELFKRRILVLGAGERAKILSDVDKAIEKDGYKIIGYIKGNTSTIKVPEHMIMDIETT